MRHVMAMCFAILAADAARGADIRLIPGDQIIAYPINPGRNYHDLVVHAVAVRSGPGETITVDQLVIDLVAGDRAILRQSVSGDQLVQSTSRLMSAPVPAMISSQLLSPDGLEGLFGQPTAGATSTRIAPGQALVSTAHYFAVPGEISHVEVTLEGRDANSEPVRQVVRVPVRTHSSPIEYRPPLRGTWLAQAVPSLQSHHRLNPPTEFALDFFKVDDQGGLYRGDPMQGESSFGWGAEVLAAAGGTVVKVNDGDVQDRAAMLRRPDESPQAAVERIGRHIATRFAGDFERAAAGNLVILRHEADGIIEYSSYGHLQAGIPVRVGDVVRQGQIVGRVGDTGDSAAVHLHFQINRGPDPFTSQSLPIRLNGMRSAGGNSELGRFVLLEPTPNPSVPPTR